MTTTPPLLARPLFPFLLLAFFLVHGALSFFGLIPLVALLKWAGIYGALTIALYRVHAVVFGSNTRAALLTFLLLLTELYFGVFFDALAKAAPAIARYSLVLPVCLGILAFAWWRLYRSRRHFPVLVKYLNATLLVLLLLDGVQGAYRLLRQEPFALSPLALNDHASAQKSDVYLIVADEYAGDRQLTDIFHFDNGPFLRRLEERGFHVVRNAHSNYSNTEYSMASFLSGSYLDVSAQTNLRDISRCFRAIEKNPVTRYFTENGYRLHNLSVFDVGGQPRPVPDAFGLRSEQLLTGITLSHRLQRDLGYHLVDWGLKPAPAPDVYAYRKNIVYLSDSLRRLAAQVEGPPRFVYTHLDMPHSPFYFDREGRPNPPSLLTYRQKTDTARYIGYLQYANGVYLELIDRIRSNPKRTAIIVFMGDHGFRGFDQRIPAPYYFSTLYAIRKPDGDYRGHYDGMSHVNALRVFLNGSFGQRLPLLPDSATFIQDVGTH